MHGPCSRQIRGKEPEAWRVQMVSARLTWNGRDSAGVFFSGRGCR
jgi:hypothetical protein